MIDAVSRKGDSGTPAPAALAGTRGPRLVALFIDTVVFSVGAVVLGEVFGVDHVPSGIAVTLPAPSIFSFLASTHALNLWQMTLAWLIYFAGSEVLFGRTLGKVVAGVVIVSVVDGSRAGWRQLLVRNLLRPIDALPFWYLIGGVTVLATPRHQRIGDLAAATVAVDARSVSLPTLPRRRLRLAIAICATAALVGSSMAFEYFGQPPLVLQGLVNTMGNRSPFTMGFGSPVWGAGKVTYPIISVNGNACRGDITLHWQGFLSGWSSSGWSWACTLGHPG